MAVCERNVTPASPDRSHPVRSDGDGRGVARREGARGGGGPHHGYQQQHINIRNSPGLVGFKLRKTVIFGKYIHDQIEVGLPVDRSPAYECHASLYDKATKQHIAPLWWRTRDGTMTRSVTLKSGESATLMLFAREHNDRRKYFAYQLKDGASKELLIPNDEDKLEGSRDFSIRVVYHYGNITFRIGCSINPRLRRKAAFSVQGRRNIVLDYHFFFQFPRVGERRRHPRPSATRRHHRWPN